MSEETSYIIPYKANVARFVNGSDAIFPVNKSWKWFFETHHFKAQNLHSTALKWGFS